jgi:molecular chaperone GrpE
MSGDDRIDASPPGGQPGADVETAAAMPDVDEPVGTGSPDDDAEHMEAAVEADLQALLAERDSFKDIALRLQADFENFRRRVTTQHAEDIDRATGKLAEAMLPVLDAAEAAFVQHPAEVEPLFNLMLGELRRAGLEAMNLDGQPFDPNLAEAVLHEPGDGGEPIVAEVLRSGYLWKGKVLRPAMVKVLG